MATSLETPHSYDYKHPLIKRFLKELGVGLNVWFDYAKNNDNGPGTKGNSSIDRVFAMTSFTKYLKRVYPDSYPYQLRAISITNLFRIWLVFTHMDDIMAAPSAPNKLAIREEYFSNFPMYVPIISFLKGCGINVGSDDDSEVEQIKFQEICDDRITLIKTQYKI